MCEGLVLRQCKNQLLIYDWVQNAKLQTLFTGTVPTLKAAINALHSVCPKWYNIGVQLEVPTFQLKIIEKKTNDSMEQLRDTLDFWMSNDLSPSWKCIADALKAPSVGENRLAKAIEEKYCDSEKQSSCNESKASVQTKHHQGNIPFAIVVWIFTCIQMCTLFFLQKFQIKATKKLQKEHPLLLHQALCSQQKALPCQYSIQGMSQNVLPEWRKVKVTQSRLLSRERLKLE